MPTVPITSNTLGQMKTDIADEIGRSDLTTQIASKIAEAIDFYQAERFWFSESRDITFNTTATKEFYAEADVPGISTLSFIDYVILYIGSIPWPIARRTDTEIEVLNQNGKMTGQPWNYSYYNEQLRLGPVPDTVYSMRIAAHKSVAPPASDSEVNNPWMTNAETLIRSRAKYLIWLHVIRNFEEAEAMGAAVTEAFDMLKGKTNRLVGRGIMAPMEM
jgi:hypothetical protein